MIKTKIKLLQNNLIFAIPDVFAHKKEQQLYKSNKYIDNDNAHVFHRYVFSFDSNPPISCDNRHISGNQMVVITFFSLPHLHVEDNVDDIVLIYQ